MKTIRWPSRVLVLGFLLLGGCWVEAVRAADPVLPRVTGKLSEQIGAADVEAMCALAKPLVARPLGKPFLVAVDTTSEKDGSPRLWSATIYFEPTEATPDRWRGFSMVCYREQSSYPEDGPVRRRTVGGWYVFTVNKIDEYLVLPPAGETLLAWAPEGFRRSESIILNSSLDTDKLLALVETARGYSMVLKDGTELPFRGLRVWQVWTEVEQAGQTKGTVNVLPPLGKVKLRFPFHVHTILQKKHDWRIESVDQYVY